MHESLPLENLNQFQYNWRKSVFFFFSKQWEIYGAWVHGSVAGHINYVC